MKWLLALVCLPAFAGVKIITPTLTALADSGYLTYTNDISVQTVLTQDRVDACRGRFLMFDIDGLQRAYYGCWSAAQGFAHIEMADGSRRIMPLSQFTRSGSTATQLKMERVK